MIDLTDPATVSAIDNFDAIAAYWAGAIDPSLRPGLQPLTASSPQALTAQAANTQTLLIIAVVVVVLIVVLRK